MQREIKFKAKRIDTNEWVIGVPYPVKQESKCFIINNCKSLNFTKEDTTFEGIEVQPETVCQFTGLLDKNDKEIYEGDIYNVETTKFNYVVSFRDGIFCGNILNSKEPPLPLCWDEADGFDKFNEIIIIKSNIHD